MRDRIRKYRNISNIDELRIERAKLSMLIELKEFELKQDFNDLQNAFSWDGLVRSIFGGIGFSSIWDGITSGFHTITSLFGGGKKRKKRKSLPAYCED